MISGRLANKRQIADETMEYSFQTEEAVPFNAGGYCRLILNQLVSSDPEGNSRKFSFVNSPLDNKQITIALRKGQSGYKQTLRELPLGAKVEIGKIKDKLSLPENADLPLVFIAGGIGVTPFISYLRYAQQRKLRNKITMFYFNRNQESAAYLPELQSIERENAFFTLIPSMTQDSSWQGEKRRLSTDLLKDHLNDYLHDLYYVVGTPVMVKSVEETLQDSKIDHEKIHTEDFEGYEN